MDDERLGAVESAVLAARDVSPLRRTRHSWPRPGEVARFDCATWTGILGLALPERSGFLSRLIPALVANARVHPVSVATRELGVAEANRVAGPSLNMRAAINAYDEARGHPERCAEMAQAEVAELPWRISETAMAWRAARNANEVDALVATYHRLLRELGARGLDADALDLMDMLPDVRVPPGWRTQEPPAPRTRHAATTGAPRNAGKRTPKPRVSTILRRTLRRDPEPGGSTPAESLTRRRNLLLSAPTPCPRKAEPHAPTIAGDG